MGARLASRKLDDTDPVAEAMHDHDGRDHDPQPAADRQRRSQGHAIEEAVDAHPRGPDDARVLVRRGFMVELGSRLVADVERRQLVDGVEGQKASSDHDHRDIDRAQMGDRLGDEIEERGPDPDACPRRDDHADVPDRPQRQPAADDGGGERAQGNGERGDGCARHQSTVIRQAGQRPNSSSRWSSIR